MSPSYLAVLGLTYSRIYFLLFCWSAVYCRKWTLQAVCFRLLCLLGLANGRQCGGSGGGMLEGHGREKSGIFCPLFWAVFLKVAMAETSPGSRFWTGHCGSSFCQVTIVHVFLERRFLPSSLVTESSSFSHRGSHSKYLRLWRPHSFCWNFSALWMGGGLFDEGWSIYWREGWGLAQIAPGSR